MKGFDSSPKDFLGDDVENRCVGSDYRMKAQTGT
jgi:hypothetical protein